MCRSKFRLSPLPLPLRWVLAIVLILNGAVVPPTIALAAVTDEGGHVAHATSTHCHHQEGTPVSEHSKHHQNQCACCSGGNACQCGCLVALPVVLSDQRAYVPASLANRLRATEPTASPRRRLLRPPIV